ADGAAPERLGAMIVKPDHGLMQARAAGCGAASEKGDGGIVDPAVLLRVDEGIEQRHACDAERKALRGLDLGLSLLRGAALLDGEPLFGIGRDASAKFLAERADYLTERVVFALDPVEPFPDRLHVRVGLRPGR